MEGHVEFIHMAFRFLGHWFSVWNSQRDRNIVSGYSHGYLLYGKMLYL